MKTTVTLKQVPSKVSRKLTCIAFVNQHVCMQLVEDNDGVGDIHTVYKNNVNIGKVVLIYGDNGKGKLTSAKFTPLPSAKMKWINNDEGWEEERDNYGGLIVY